MLSSTAGDGPADLDHVKSLTFQFNYSHPQGILAPNRYALVIVDMDFFESVYAGEYSNYSDAVAAAALYDGEIAHQSEDMSLFVYNALRNAQQVIRLRQGPGFLFII
jgi:hypothetical protein